MVSVNEKCYIDRLACECFSLENHVLNSNDSLEKYKALLSSRVHKNSPYDKRENCKTESKPKDYNLAGVSDMRIYSISSKSSARKKIIWNDKVINEINSTLTKSNLSVNNHSKADCFKKNVGNSCVEQLICYEQIQKIDGSESYNKPQSIKLYGNEVLAEDIENKVVVKKKLPEVDKNKRRCFNYEIYTSQFDEPQEMLSNSVWETQRHIFSIPQFNISSFKNGKYVDYDRILISIWERTRDFEDWVKCNKPKVSLLGDSHTRFLADILIKMLPSFKIEETVKPGAKCSKVMLSLPRILQNLDKNDFVVIITGTNDMWSESLEEAKGVMYNAVTHVTNTNLLLCCVPNNYLEPWNSPVQDNILFFNEFYKDLVKFTKSTHLVDLHELKDRGLFTRHGLHFNQGGKIKICQMVSHKILDIINSIIMFY